MSGLFERAARSGWVHGAGGFLLMGGWAVFANRAHPMPAPLIAGLVQGALTAIITLILKRIVEAVSARTGGLARRLLPPAAAFLTSLVLLTSVHTLAGTPALWATISVPLTVATVYAFIYAQTLAAAEPDA